MAGGVHDGGHVWWEGCAWGGGARGRGACMAGGCACHTHPPWTPRDTVGQCTGGTHATEIHSCLDSIFDVRFLQCFNFHQRDFLESVISILFLFQWGWGGGGLHPMGSAQPPGLISSGGHCSSQYASYCNAFLFKNSIV